MSQNKPIIRSWLLGAVEYTRVGEVSLTQVFGVEVYSRVFEQKAIFGFVWGRKE